MDRPGVSRITSRLLPTYTIVKHSVTIDALVQSQTLVYGRSHFNLCRRYLLTWEYCTPGNVGRRNQMASGITVASGDSFWHISVYFTLQQMAKMYTWQNTVVSMWFWALSHFLSCIEFGGKYSQGTFGPLSSTGLPCFASKLKPQQVWTDTSFWNLMKCHKQWLHPKLNVFKTTGMT